MAIDVATRDSLELTRSITGSIAGNLFGEIEPLPDRGGTAPACGGHFRAVDRQAPIESSPRARRMAARRCHPRERTRQALKAMPDFARALARLAAGRGSPRDLALLRDGWSAAAELKRELEVEMDRPALLESLLPRLGGHRRPGRRARTRAGRFTADQLIEGRLHRRRL